MAEKVLAAVRTGPSKTEIREYPMPDIPADSALMKMEVGGICGTDVKLYKHPPTEAPVIMGHENIGTIAKAGSEFTKRKGFKEGDLVFVEHYVDVRQMRVVPSRPVSPLREHQLAHQSGRHPLRLHLGREGAPSVGRLCAVRLSAVECGGASRAQGSLGGAGRAGDPDGERRRMVAVRRRRRLQLDRADPGAGPAGPVADRDLQAGRRFAHHRHRHLQGRRPHGGRQGARRRLRDRRAEGGPARPHHGDHRRQGRRRRRSTAPPAPAPSRSCSASRRSSARAVPSWCRARWRPSRTSRWKSSR